MESVAFRAGLTISWLDAFTSLAAFGTLVAVSILIKVTCFALVGTYLLDVDA